MHAAWGRALLPALSFIALTSLTGPLRAATYGAALTNLCDAVAGGGTPVNLDALCSGGGVIDGIPVDAVSFGSSLTPTDNLSSAIVSSDSTQTTQSALQDRFDDQRLEQRPLPASAEGLVPTTGFFVTLKSVTGDRDNDRYRVPSTASDCNVANQELCAGDIETGFDYEYFSLLLGYDTRLNQDLIVGLAGTFSSGDSSADGSASSSSFEDLLFTAYANGFGPAGLYWDASLGLGWGENSIRRALSYTMEVSNQAATFTNLASGSPEKTLWSASAGLGKDFALQAWTISPSLRVDWSQTDIDGYRETSTLSGVSDQVESLVIDNLLLRVDEQEVTTLSSRLSVDVTRAFSVSNGVVVPMLSLSWIKQYEDQEELTSQFLFQGSGDQSFKFTTETPELDDNYFSLGAGVSQTFPGGLTSFALVETLLGHSDISQFALSVGFRQDF
ncbi:MAG: hypothetical protein CML06_11510 [Pseudomonadales bacterium]|nr:hypothetical protein [Pseudomonadales bacterium]